MEEWGIILIERGIYVSYLMEFIAAFAGTLYLLVTKYPDRNYKLFVRYLWSILIIDIMGGFSGLAYYSDYEYFGFIEGTPFVRNEWYYNMAQVYFVCAYSYFLRKQLSNIFLRKILKWSILIYLVFSAINMMINDNFFDQDIVINYITGALLILLSVFAYFYDMLVGDKILSFYKKLFFYVAVGVTMSFLTRIPITIYYDFHNTRNMHFVDFFNAVVRYSNIFMYAVFAFGFYMEFRFQKKSILGTSMH